MNATALLNETIRFIPQWLKLTVLGWFNIVSHKSLVKPDKIMYLFYFICIFFIVCIIINFYKSLRSKNKNRQYIYLHIIACSYVLIVFFYVNYSALINRLKNGLTGNALYEGIQGRYLFPILAALVTITTISINQLIKKVILRKLLFLGMICFFIYIDIIFALQNYKKWIFRNYWLDAKLGNTGPILIGESSLTQSFYVSNNNIGGIGIFISTYNQKINGQINLELFQSNCKKLIKTLPFREIKDNQYNLVKTDKLLSPGNYCFRIVNKNSNKPITLWYSGINLDGFVLNNENDFSKDLIYDLIPNNLVIKYFP